MASKNLPIVDWLEIHSSAPGKFIISGEYSVVYDKQAIASAIDLRTRVIIRPNKEAKIRVNFKNLNCVREWPASSLTMFRLVNKFSECLDFHDGMPIKLSQLLNSRYHDTRNQPSTQESDAKTATGTTKDVDKKAEDATMAFLLLYIGLGDSYASSARPPIDVEVDSNVPVGSGLGSSSALSVALCGALMKVFRVAAEKYIISNWALNIDKFFHGKPSGVDNSIITHGGHILFQNGKIKSTGVTHRSWIKVLLVETGVSRSTKTLSEIVTKQMREDAQRITGIFNNINEITTQIWRKLNDPDFAPRNINTYISANQELLDALGVGHEKITDICARAADSNLRAKQTGAGGGGTVFILYDEVEDRQLFEMAKTDLANAGYKVHEHAIGCDGLTVSIVPDPARRILSDR